MSTTEAEVYFEGVTSNVLSWSQQQFIKTICPQAKTNREGFYWWGDLGTYWSINLDQITNWFDLLITVTAEGQRRLIVQARNQSMTEPWWGEYQNDDFLLVSAEANSCFFDWEYQHEPGEIWVPDNGWGLMLKGIAQSILAKDRRPFYLGWLRWVQHCGESNTVGLPNREPAIPPGLRTLSQSLEGFVEWLGLDSDLLDCASLESISFVELLAENKCAPQGSGRRVEANEELNRGLFGSLSQSNRTDQELWQWVVALREQRVRQHPR